MQRVVSPSEQSEGKIYHSVVLFLAFNNLRRWMLSSGTDAGVLNEAVKVTCTLFLTNFLKK